MRTVTTELVVKMELINISVYSSISKKTIMPWTIVQLKEESHTFSDFFVEDIIPRLPADNGAVTYRLEAAYVGPDKVSLDLVDVGLTVVSVVNSFGRYLKYCVESEKEPELSAAISTDVPAISQSQSFLTPVHERNKKDKLYNDLVSFFISKEALMEDDEVQIFGKELVMTLRDVLWYVDGYHTILAQRAISIPTVFQLFSNYNVPELSKHRKRRTANISSDQLGTFVQDLCQILHRSYWERPQWKELKPSVIQLSESLASYIEYLSAKNKKSKLNHRSPTPIRELGHHLKLNFISVSEDDILPCLQSIDDLILGKPVYTFIPLINHLPQDPVKKHRLIYTLETCGLSSSCMLLTYSPGSNIGNMQFIWKVPSTDAVTQCFEDSQSVLERIKEVLPVYHTRAMRTAMFEKFGRISPHIKPAVLRFFYRDLTGDQSAADSTQQSLVDKRIQQIIDMEDVDVLPDLRALNSHQSTKYDHFWEECEKFLSEDIGIAVDDRRHGQVTHMARAISLRDLVQQVKARCPEGTEIPSLEWVRLQFWPKTTSMRASLHNTGRFKMKFMVQQRQWRCHHVDAHYASACYRYMREYAILVRDHCLFVSIDDKHKIPVGEPDYPVAAVERGRRVLVRSDENFTVGDHDFTKFGIIPSVNFFIDIPEEISQSWYRGRVFVGLKSSVFEPSSPMRHMCELYQIISADQSYSSKSILFIYSDGGPDHRLTYVSVQLSLICLFLKLDLDYLCACRTAPYHSWRNPVERIMSVLNLGLQCVGLARAKMAETFENEVAKCNTMAELRRIAVTGFQEGVQDSLSPVKILLSSIFIRLQIHDEFIHTFVSASLTEISDFWTTLLVIDSTLKQDIQYTKKNFPTFAGALEFVRHCCQVSHYSFDILKCGSDTCSICKPVRLSNNIFSTLHHIPHPTPGEDGHYIPFMQVYGTETSEEHRPSFKKPKPTVTVSKKNTLPFYASVQHVKNSLLMVQCDECSMWRLIYSKYKLKQDQRIKLQVMLENYAYTCGAKLSELQLPVEFADVEIKEHVCYDPIEKLYYSAKFDPICIHCGKDEPYTSDDRYPHCQDCQDKAPIFKK